jgi:hypothetical protein
VDSEATANFEVFVRARTPALLRSAFLLTGDQQLAEDLVQSALARTHRSWDRLHAAGNAEAYTRRTMYHLQVSCGAGGGWPRYCPARNFTARNVTTRERDAAPTTPTR